MITVCRDEYLTLKLKGNTLAPSLFRDDHRNISVRVSGK